MRVAIDFSVYTEEEGSFGVVSGEINVVTVPQIGDSVSFVFPGNSLVLDPSIGFDGILEVTHRIVAANQENRKLVICLSDVTVRSKIDAKNLSQYFESAFNLYTDIHE